MTPKEAIKILGVFDFMKVSISGNARDVAEFFEACYMGAEALEKQIPKKPSVSNIDDNDNADVHCPICYANNPTSIKSIHRIHCWRCGQLLAIDWSEE